MLNIVIQYLNIFVINLSTKIQNQVHKKKRENVVRSFIFSLFVTLLKSQIVTILFSKLYT